MFECDTDRIVLGYGSADRGRAPIPFTARIFEMRCNGSVVVTIFAALAAFTVAGCSQNTHGTASPSPELAVNTKPASIADAVHVVRGQLDNVARALPSATYLSKLHCASGNITDPHCDGEALYDGVHKGCANGPGATYSVTYAIETLPTYENDDLNLIESAWKAAGWQPDGFYAAAGNSDIHGWRSLGGYNVNASIIGQQLTVHASTPCVNDTTFASSVDSDLPETIRG